MSTKSRMKSPVLVIPAALEAMQLYSKAVEATGISYQTLELVRLRASQINGCAVCLDMHWRALKKKCGETDERLATLAAWREAPYFTDAERAALALAEAMTRIADRSDPVSDEVWADATRHYSESQVSALMLAIAQINMFNRINAATRQVTGPFVEQFI